MKALWILMLVQCKPRLHINNLHWNQYWYENQDSVWLIRNLKRMACKMKCQVILWEDTWVKAKGSLKGSSGMTSYFTIISHWVSVLTCVCTLCLHTANPHCRCDWWLSQHCCQPLWQLMPHATSAGRQILLLHSSLVWASVLNQTW